MYTNSNLNKPTIKIEHSKLERYDEDSAYKSKCPACNNGILLIHRDDKSFSIQRNDMCTNCGQKFYYTDQEINGEKFIIPYPMFELYGPPCEVPGCYGVLVDTVSIKTKRFFRKCATCGAEHYKLNESIGWTVRTIEKVFNGDKVN